MFYETSLEYREYLSEEVSDAFIIALLPLALRNNWDIMYDGLMTAYLKFQLNSVLLPSLCRFAWHSEIIRIVGKTVSHDIETAGAVGTGISGGVDSFYTILHNKEFDDIKITHLCFYEGLRVR